MRENRNSNQVPAFRAPLTLSTWLDLGTPRLSDEQGFVCDNTKNLYAVIGTNDRNLQFNPENLCLLAFKPLVINITMPSRFLRRFPQRLIYCVTAR